MQRAAAEIGSSVLSTETGSKPAALFAAPMKIKEVKADTGTYIHIKQSGFETKKPPGSDSRAKQMGFLMSLGLRFADNA